MVLAVPDSLYLVSSLVFWYVQIQYEQMVEQTVKEKNALITELSAKLQQQAVLGGSTHDFFHTSQIKLYLLIMNTILDYQAIYKNAAKAGLS